MSALPRITIVDVVDEGPEVCPSPMTYYVAVGAIGTVVVTARQLCSFRFFNEACVEQLSRCFEPLTKKTWSQLVDEALRKRRKAVRS